jgi:hypothetical protein
VQEDHRVAGEPPGSADFPDRDPLSVSAAGEEVRSDETAVTIALGGRVRRRFTVADAAAARTPTVARASLARHAKSTDDTSAGVRGI